MSAKSIIEVAVDDSQFKAFFDLYQVYKEHLDSAPEEWRKTGDAINEAGGGMESFSEATKESKDFLAVAAAQAAMITEEIKKASASNNALLENLTKNAKAQRNFADESERSNKALKEMKKHAEGVAGSIFGIGKWLIKIGTWGAGLAGLGGLLSGFGLKELASSAVDTQRGARGLSMTPGQLTAFRQDFGGRYLDESVLGSVANAQNSFIGRVWLSRAAGQDMGQVESADPGQLAAQLAIRAHDWWQNTPANMRTSEMLQSSGFAQSGFSLAMMRQLGNTPVGELQRAASQYQSDQGRFAFGDQGTDTWYGFLRQIKDAGNVIETDLKNRLVDLAPSLQHFVDVIGKDAMKLIDQIFTPQNLSALERGIDKLSEYLGSKEFAQNIKEFGSAVRNIAQDVKALASLLDKLASPFKSKLAEDAAKQQQELGGGLIDAAKNIAHGNFSAAWKALNAPISDGVTPSVTAPSPLSAPAPAPKLSGSQTAPHSIFSEIEAANNLPSGLMFAQMVAESHGNARAKSPAGAKGLFQIMDSTAKDYGLDNPFDPVASTRVAGRIDGDLLRKYGGDVRKMLAAYNWGQGNLDSNLSKHGQNWEQHLPAETRNYLNKILTALARQQGQGLTVRVENNTSARVAIQANAAAAQ